MGLKFSFDFTIILFWLRKPLVDNSKNKNCDIESLKEKKKNKMDVHIKVLLKCCQIVIKNKNDRYQIANQRRMLIK